LVLDAGDLLFKKFSNPIPENEVKMVTEKAHLIIESFGLMGYDALGIGDDDLSLGKDFLMEVSKRAKFPFISSNLLDEATKKPLFQPFVIKEINGLRIGIFSLLSPDFLTSLSEPKRKGLILGHPVNIAQTMVKELQSKSDLIILLSHLGYAKDIELAQTLQGINIIIGSHTGINLSYAPVINNTIIVQMVPKGMYTGRLDLTFNKEVSTFYNTMTKRSMENSLNNLTYRLNSQGISENERAQLQKLKEDMERTLRQLQGKNEFTNTISPLMEEMKEDPDIGKLIEAFKSKYPETGKP
jgi:2',3'-cyclic-nucleotide 2'-phosphodiesterase (5'-nucleotidase family)